MDVMFPESGCSPAPTFTLTSERSLGSNPGVCRSDTPFSDLEQEVIALCFSLRHNLRVVTRFESNLIKNKGHGILGLVASHHKRPGTLRKARRRRRRCSLLAS